MAIFNSILIGKGKNKIGDVVLTTLKGQSVAKQINRSPANPRTTLQVASRNKMTNAVMAWQFLSIFLAYARYERKKVESTYNWFVSMVKNLLANTVFDSAFDAAASLFTLLSFGTAKLALVTGGTSGNASVVVTFETNGMPFVPDAKIVVANFDGTEKKITIANKTVTESEWNDGQITVPAAVSATIGSLVYIYSDKSKKQSNIAFVTSVA